MHLDYDVIIIGAGHNALISGAYLAQAGHTVTVFERREIVGARSQHRRSFPAINSIWEAVPTSLFD